jgi:hypothetical protein
MDALDAVRDQWLFCDPPMPPSRRESPPRAVDCGTCRESPPERRAASKQGKQGQCNCVICMGGIIRDIVRQTQTCDGRVCCTQPRATRPRSPHVTRGARRARCQVGDVRSATAFATV